MHTSVRIYIRMYVQAHTQKQKEVEVAGGRKIQLLMLEFAGACE